MSNDKNKPLETIRDGAIKATIWKNKSEKGHFYSVEFSRTYLDGEVFKDSGSFSGSDVLKVAHLAGQAYSQIMALRKQDAEASKDSNAA